MKMFCHHCQDLCDAEEVFDETGYSYLKCLECGGDDCSEAVTCHICGRPVAREDATWHEDNNHYCQNCIDYHAKAGVSRLSWQERVAINIKYDGEQI